MSAELPAQPAASGSGYADLGEKAIGPKQPILSSFPKRLIGNVNRAFSTFYYHKFPWMEYSISLDSVFCFCCRHFSSNIARSDADELFTKVGAQNWKKVSEKRTKHASSQVHSNSMKMWESYKQAGALGLPFLLQLALTLPVGSPTSERSFPVMRRIRNWLRSAMAQDRFSNLSLLHIEKDLTANLSEEKIVDIYATRKKRRLLLH